MHEVSRFAPHVGQHGTIDLYQKSLEFSSHENAKEKLHLLLNIIYVKESI